MKNRIIATILMTFGLALGATTASAVLIEGDITMSGDFAPTGGTGLGNATGIDFLGDDFQVDDANGDFAAYGISFGDTGFYQDFVFNPLNPATTDPLWAIAGFEFALEAVSIVFQSNDFLILRGTGTVSHVDFDDTNGTWNLTGNRAGMLFNFSSGASAVNEPAILFLMGLGLVGFAAARRRRS